VPSGAQLDRRSLRASALGATSIPHGPPPGTSATFPAPAVAITFSQSGSSSELAETAAEFDDPHGYTPLVQASLRENSDRDCGVRNSMSTMRTSRERGVHQAVEIPIAPAELNGKVS